MRNHNRGMAISVGSQAPDFKLRGMTQDGAKDFSLAEHKGKSVVVLLFFPAAFTGVCTEQMCDPSGGMGGYGEAVVYGISADTVFAQANWAKQNNITVQLLSDYQKSTIDAYGTTLADLAGMGKGSNRAAFVIDRNGTVVYSEQTPAIGELPDSAAIRAAVDAAS